MLGSDIRPVRRASESRSKPTRAHSTRPAGRRSTRARSTGRSISTPNRTKRRSVIVFLRRLLLLTLLVGVLGLAIYLLTADNFAINRLQIEGIEEEPGLQSEVEAVVKDYLDQKIYYFLSPRNQFLFSPQALQQRLMSNHPEIKTVTARINNQKLTLSLNRREPVAKWCDEPEKSCLLIDDEGYAFAVLDNTQTDQDWITYVTKDVPKMRTLVLTKAFAELSYTISELEKRYQWHTDKVTVINHYLTLTSEQGSNVLKTNALVMNTDDIEGSLQTLTLLKEEEAFRKVLDKEGGIRFESIDLTNPDKVFYRFVPKS